MNNTKNKTDSWGWFGLSYASWLVVPRIALQSMPEGWQHQFFGMLNELEEELEHPEGYKDLEFTVRLRKYGKFVKSPYPPYRHNVLNNKMPL